MKHRATPHPDLKLPLEPRAAFEPLKREGERLLKSLGTIFSEGCPVDSPTRADLPSRAEFDERWRDLELAAFVVRRLHELSLEVERRARGRGEA